MTGPKPWRRGSLPRLAPLWMVVAELARSAADGVSDIGVDEAGTLLASRFARIAGARESAAPSPPPRDRRRAVEAALWIDEHCEGDIGLETAAAEEIVLRPSDPEPGEIPVHFPRSGHDVLQ